jgi:hypothetical protein
MIDRLSDLTAEYKLKFLAFVWMVILVGSGPVWAHIIRRITIRRGRTTDGISQDQGNHTTTRGIRGNCNCPTEEEVRL